MASLKTLRLKKLENLNAIEEIVEGRTYYVESNNTLYRDVLSTRMAVGQVYFAPKGIANLGEEKTLTLSNVLVILNENVDSDTPAYRMGMYDENGEYIDLSAGILIKNVELDDENNLILTFEDGTTTSVPLSDLLAGVVKSVNGETPNSSGAVLLSYNDLEDLPSLFSGNYDDLTNKPTIPTIPSVMTTTEGSTGTATTQRTINAKNLKDIILNHSPAGARPSSWSQVSGKPSFATVATSGSYNDLSNKPTIPAAQVQSDWSATTGMGVILNKPNLATVATSGNYNDLSNKPSIPSIPGVMDTTEGNAGTATIQRTINAKNLKDIILHHSPAGSRPASDVSAWAKKSSLAIEDIPTGITESTVALGNHIHSAATTSVAGFLSAVDKTKLDGIEAGAEVNPYSKTQLDNMFDDKVDKNANIAPGTHPKITYDAKGLVTGGGVLLAADIPNLAASKINSGTFADARIPTLPISKITNLQSSLDSKTSVGHLHNYDDIKTGDMSFNGVYFKRHLGKGNSTPAYVNIPADERHKHRFWRISFPSGVNFWGKIKITLYGGYSSFNASGKMSKEINVNFNGSSMFSNVGSYTELSGYVEYDFRISEAIWNDDTLQWEFLIYSDKLSGNNVPSILIEGWAVGSNYENAFKGITFTPTPELREDTTYDNVKGNALGQTLTKNWSDLPTFQSPYGLDVLTDDMISAWAKKSSLAIEDIPTGITESTVALGNHIHSAATTSAAGFMSSADKSKLDGIETGAQKNVDLNTTAYFNYAASVYGDRYSLLASAWEHSLTVNPSEISVNSSLSNVRGRAQYPNGATEGVIIPQGVTNIGSYAFDYWTSNNQPLVIPNSVTTIGSYAFRYWQSNNQPLVIPNSVTSIDSNAFGYWQGNNQPLVIPNSVTSIESAAFRDWRANNHPLVIPDSVTDIGEYAFNYWQSVPYVEIQVITPPTLAGIVAFGGQNNAPIYVPDESVNDYKTATNWVNLANRIFPISDKVNEPVSIWRYE